MTAQATHLRSSSAEGASAAPDVLVCPSCHGALTIGETSLACEACAQEYPTIGGAIPLLVSDARTVVHRTFAELHRLSSGAGEKSARCADAASRSSDRRESLERLSEAYACNRRFIRELQELLRPLTSVDQVLDATRAGARADQPPDYLEQVAGFIRRDWSRQPECEAEVAAVMEAIWAALAAHAPGLDRVLVIGAGTARFAYELTARANEVFAVDRSLAMGASVHVLRGGPRRFCEISETNVAHVRDQVRAFDAAIPNENTEGANTERLRYAVADALAVPLPDRSVSAVVSVYSTDVVPPTQLIAEVRRLLVPNGQFLHFGPLMYHFSGIGEQRAADELVTLFEERGFDIRDERWVSLPHLHSAVRLSTHQIRNWCLSAILRPEAGMDGVRDEDVLVIRGTPTLNVQYRLKDGGEQLMGTGLLTADGLQVPIDRTTLTVLRLVNARRTTAEIAALAALDLPAEASAILQTIDRLVRTRIVGVHERPLGPLTVKPGPQ